MIFSDLKHEANEAQYHLTMYTRYMNMRKIALGELELIPWNHPLTAWRKKVEVKNFRSVALGHLDRYNTIMTHLNELYPAKRTLESLGI